ncbi:MAG: PqiC family protein [Pararobbsia sp.]
MMPIESTRRRTTTLPSTAFAPTGRASRSPAPRLGARCGAFALYAACALALFLAGCAAPQPDHFYTLSGREGAAIYRPSAAEAAPFYIDVADASIPDDVARQPMVLDLGDGRVTIAEHQRWIGPLSTEISHAVSDYLTHSLHTIDVYRSPHPNRLPVYRVSMAVRRFVSVPDQSTAIDMVWTVRREDPSNPQDAPIVTCRSVVNEKIGTGYDAIAQGHRRGLQQIAADIGGVITTLNELPPPAVVPAAKPAPSGKGKSQAAAATPAAPAAPMVPCP